MTLLLALRVLGTVYGTYLVYRAIARRLSRRRRGQVLTRVTLGLQAVAVVASLMLLGLLMYPEPGWIGQVANGLIVGGLCVIFPLALWIGWQLSTEDELNEDDPTAPSGRQDEQVA